MDKELFLAQVFEKLDFSKLSKIPASEQKNLFKYHWWARPVGDVGYSVDEGFIDNSGNMLIALPKNEKFEFQWQPPYIIVTFLKSDGEELHHLTDKKSILIIKVNR